ncbi:Bzz1 protein [Martiniozyma asiatica (nom. inval.)]|nr:Bzz1 protein [Martiniozyma asiatica]
MQSIGDNLSSYSKVSNWIHANIGSLNDVETFYSQRAIIEREYAEKLGRLVSESFAKRNKQALTLSVGDEPTMTPGSLEAASVVAWKEVLIQTEAIVGEKKRFAGELDNVAGGFSRMKSKYGDLEDRWKQVHDEIGGVRDNNVNEMKAKKKAYDATCESMESQRGKSMKSSGEKSQTKLKTKTKEMNIAKNAYLISVAVTNRLKDKYHYQDVPEILDGLQALNEAKVSKFNSFLLKATDLERKSLSNVENFTKAIDDVVKQNLPKLDTAMFIKHNISKWSEPADYQYIPSHIWHDDDTIITDPEELHDLKIRLNDACALYERYTQICDDEKQTVEELLEQRNKLVGDTFDEVKRKPESDYTKFEELLAKSITYLQKFLNDDSRRVIAEVTIETIQSATQGFDMTITEPIHQQKKSKFGFLKLKNDEPEPDVHEISDAVNTIKISPKNHKIRLFKSGLVSHLLDSYNKPATFKTSESHTDNVNIATALYPYHIQGDDELNMTVGEVFTVIEPDDGSGWTVVQNSSGVEGLIPSAYVQLSFTAAVTSSKKQGPKVAPRRGAKKVKKMEILYDYTAQGDDEVSVQKGEVVEIVQDDEGGWTEVEVSGIRGLIPSSYGQVC